MGIGDNAVLCLIEYLTPTVSLAFLWITFRSHFEQRTLSKKAVKL